MKVVGNNSNKNNNSRVTIAVIGQKLDDHIRQYDKDYADTKTNIKDISTVTGEIKTLLVAGENKIYSNRENLKEHKKNHWKIITLLVSGSALLASVVAWVLANG